MALSNRCTLLLVCALALAAAFAPAALAQADPAQAADPAAAAADAAGDKIVLPSEVKPEDPEAPVVEPATPVEPVDPATGEPATPADPATAAEPATPAVPAEGDEAAAAAADPAVPADADPAVPADAAVPADPADAAAAADPAVPAVEPVPEGGDTEPATPEDPAAAAVEPVPEEAAAGDEEAAMPEPEAEGDAMKEGTGKSDTADAMPVPEDEAAMDERGKPESRDKSVSSLDEETLDKMVPEALLARSEIGVHKFNTLLAAVKAADGGALEQALEAAGPFTVFAPTDEAFTAYVTASGKTPEEILASPDLKEILQHHVVQGKYTANDVMMMVLPMDIPTLDGDTIKLDKTTDGKLLVAGREVVEPDIMAKNAVIHGIDGVIEEVKQPE